MQDISNQEGHRLNMEQDKTTNLPSDISVECWHIEARSSDNNFGRNIPLGTNVGYIGPINDRPPEGYRKEGVDLIPNSIELRTKGDGKDDLKG